MRAKSILAEELAENGGFVVEEIAQKIFPEEDLQTKFQDQMERYDMVKEEVSPKNDTTVKKYQTQHLLTDTGIELKIPMDQYKDNSRVEFITESDGSISVLLRHIGSIRAKF